MPFKKLSEKQKELLIMMAQCTVQEVKEVYRIVHKDKLMEGQE